MTKAKSITNTEKKGPLAKTVTLGINDQEVNFNVSLAHYNRFVNSVTADDKVSPASNFLTSTVEPEQKPFLNDVINQGYAMELAAALIEGYRPEVTIAVKK
jgi:hypothetical protein